MQTNTANTFSGLGIAPKLLEIMEKHGFKNPTPIQLRAIPVAIEGKDLIGIAQTGTGKTLAFGIPMLQRLVITKSKGLVLLPTRELAIQVNEALKQIGRPLGLKTAIIIGGESAGRQIAAIKQDPHIIIATPGRLIDLMDSKKVNLSTIGVLVLDEADRMLDMGFAPQLRRILAVLPKKRQTLLFSATMDGEVTKIISTFMELPTRIEVAPAGSTAAQVTQEIFIVGRSDKQELLEKILNERVGSTLVFSRTKHGAKKICSILNKSGFKAAEIHSNRSLNQRLEALNGFKIGKYRVLVATDIAARGIDVTNIELVVNFDLPEQSADYVHRIGRTARAGRSGHAISFATSDQQSDIRSIERLIKTTIKVTRAATTGARRDSIPSRSEVERPSRPYGRSSGGRPSSRPPGRGYQGGKSRSDRGPRGPFKRGPSFTNGAPQIKRYGSSSSAELPDYHNDRGTL